MERGDDAGGARLAEVPLRRQFDLEALLGDERQMRDLRQHDEALPVEQPEDPSGCVAAPHSKV